MSSEGTLLARALATVSSDPEIGPVRMRRRTIAEIVPGEVADERRVKVVDRDGVGIVMTRFPAQPTRPVGYSEEIPFLANETVWAGTSEYGAVAVWLSSGDLAQLAAAVVTASVASGWELESAANFIFPDLKSVALVRSDRRRSVTIMGGLTALTDLPNASTAPNRG